MNGMNMCIFSPTIYFASKGLRPSAMIFLRFFCWKLSEMAITVMDSSWSRQTPCRQGLLKVSPQWEVFPGHSQPLWAQVLRHDGSEHGVGCLWDSMRSFCFL